MGGSASKTFKVILKSNAGIYVAIGIPVLIVVIVSSCLLRSIYLTKVVFHSVPHTKKVIVNSLLLFLHLETGQIDTAYPGEIIVER